MQIVGFDPAPNPRLTIARNGVINEIALSPGHNLQFNLLNRSCVGIVTEDTHIPCQNRNAPYCETHAHTWICARCTGVCLKDEMDCFDDHVVYLAAFPPATFKVGVTQEWRIETRLREQGADRGAVIFEVDDGRIARKIESELAQHIPDRVSTTGKIRNLHRTVDEHAWEQLVSDFDPIRQYVFSRSFELTEQPIHETIASGTVIGLKGRILVLERTGSTYAVDLRDLLGYEIKVEDIERDLQTSFRTFE